MSGVFISYRREDSQQLAGRLFDRMVQRFGKNRVFRDIDAIDPGGKFAEIIAERIGSCDALVALIGNNWLDARDAQGRRRLDLPDDFVSAEIGEALDRNKLVIPVLIEGTPMPARDVLPAKIAALTGANALPISDSRFDFDIGRLVATIAKVIPVESTSEAQDSWTLIRKRFRRLGPAGLIMLACLGIWWQWDHLRDLPGVKPLVDPIAERRLPKAIPGKFNVAVARLYGDDKEETKELILEGLAEFPSVAPLSFDVLVASGQTSDQSDIGNAELAGHDRARGLLKMSGADVLIWGRVIKQGDKRVPKLYWTPAQNVARAPSVGRYKTTDTLDLEPLFWQDLASVLGLLVATQDAEFATQEGSYTADKLVPFIQRVRELARSSNAKQWSAKTRAQVLVVLGNALVTYGEQSGKNEPLQQAVAAYREALRERTRETVPLDWAMTQNKLGHALWALGERERDTARLEEAVVAYREALKERTREKAPLEWATTQNNLGVALQSVGWRESDTTRLEEAVGAYREALKERSRAEVPLDWATTQANLGNALVSLGQRQSGTTSLEEAVAAYREALRVYTQEKVPLYWAATNANLGNALLTLGERESGAARIEEAVVAYRESLREYTPEKMPLQWAMAQNGLGTALWRLAERNSDPGRLVEAVAAYRESLKEGTREKVPLDWAATQNNLGNALWTLGQSESGTARLEEAVAAYRESLKERKREILPLDWAMTQNNLGNALLTLGQRESDTSRLEEAVAAYHASLKEYTREKTPLQWARSQYNLGVALTSLGERGSRTAPLKEAASAYEAALVVFRDANAIDSVQMTERNLDEVRRKLTQLRQATRAPGVKTN